MACASRHSRAPGNQVFAIPENEKSGREWTPYSKYDHIRWLSYHQCSQTRSSHFFLAWLRRHSYVNSSTWNYGQRQLENVVKDNYIATDNLVFYVRMLLTWRKNHCRIGLSHCNNCICICRKIIASKHFICCGQSNYDNVAHHSCDKYSAITALLCHSPTVKIIIPQIIISYEPTRFTSVWIVTDAQSLWRQRQQQMKSEIHIYHITTKRK